jgi:hypothetical protein
VLDLELEDGVLGPTKMEVGIAEGGQVGAAAQADAAVASGSLACVVDGQDGSTRGAGEVAQAVEDEAHL